MSSACLFCKEQGQRGKEHPAGRAGSDEGLACAVWVDILEEVAASHGTERVGWDHSVGRGRTVGGTPGDLLDLEEAGPGGTGEELASGSRLCPP